MVGGEAAARPGGAAYRPDVDGLRAVAVLSVLAFHLDVGPITGGFVGVDVFFVISGFLITGILARELQTGRFSLIEFYRRRARRILPALVTVLLATSIAVVLVLFEPELAGYRKSLLTATAFSSNLWFWRSSDYFAAPAAEQPLLHTWSLAVEEQYYVLFPLLLLLIHRRARTRLKALLWLGTAGSFALSAVLVRSDPGAAFYLLPARAWELGAGALLAVGAVPVVRSLALRHLLSVAGGASVLVGVLLIDDGTPFPGPAALLPVVGAAAMIHAGPDSIGGRCLALRPAVLVGLVSYSLYLWHWPLIVLYRAGHPGPLELQEKAALASVALVLAAVTWRLVEQPARTFRLPSGRHVAAFVTAAAATCAAAAMLVQPVSAVLPRTDRVAAVLEHLEPTGVDHEGDCFIAAGGTAEQFDLASCLRVDAVRPDVLVLGDSHAASLWPGLQKSLPEVNLMQATATGCKPLIPLQGTARCTDVMAAALDRLQSGPPVDGILLTARWQLEDLPRLRDTLRRLQAVSGRVVVIGPTSEYRSALPKLLAREKVSDRRGLAADNLNRRRFGVDAAWQRAVEELGVPYFSQLGLLCPQQVCREYAALNVPMKFDYGHYTGPGSELVGRRLREAGLLARLLG